MFFVENSNIFKYITHNKDSDIVVQQIVEVKNEIGLLKNIVSNFNFSVLDNHRLLPPKRFLGISMNNFVFRACSLWNKCISRIYSKPPLSKCRDKNNKEVMMVIPGSVENSDFTCSVPYFKSRLKALVFTKQKYGDNEWSKENFEL